MEGLEPPRPFGHRISNVVQTGIRRGGHTWSRTRISRLSGVRSEPHLLCAHDCPRHRFETPRWGSLAASSGCHPQDGPGCGSGDPAELTGIEPASPHRQWGSLNQMLTAPKNGNKGCKEISLPPNGPASVRQLAGGTRHGGSSWNRTDVLLTTFAVGGADGTRTRDLSRDRGVNLPTILRPQKLERRQEAQRRCPVALPTELRPPKRSAGLEPATHWLM